MKRDLHALANRNHDLLIVGGGINGVMAALEAASRGLKTALVEREDYGHATSACNSRLIHGGLRYLKQGQLGTVRSSVKERAYWLRTAPRLVQPLSFWLPTGSRVETWKTRLGLYLYDAMASTSQVPTARIRDLDELAQHFPWMDRGRYAGVLSYGDAHMPSPERLLLAAIMAARKHGAVTVNYVAVESLQRHQQRLVGANVIDLMSDNRFSVRADRVLNASGAWIDEDNLSQFPAPRTLLSSGIHLVTRSVGPQALAIACPDGHFFVIPWRGRSLIGTTDRHHQGPASTYHWREEDVNTLLERVNGALPELNLRREDLLHVYGGIRPLAHQSGLSTYRASREAACIDHGRQGGLRGVYSAVGGKWTTAREFAETIIDDLRCAPRKSISRSLLLAPRDAPTQEPLAKALIEHRDHYEWMYGEAITRLDQLIAHDPALGKILDAPEPLMGAQAVYAVREEGAIHLRDVLLRRTQAARLGPVPEATARSLAATMAPELGWNAEDIEREVQTMQSHPWQP